MWRSLTSFQIRVIRKGAAATRLEYRRSFSTSRIRRHLFAVAAIAPRRLQTLFDAEQLTRANANIAARVLRACVTCKHTIAVASSSYSFLRNARNATLRSTWHSKIRDV